MAYFTRAQTNPQFQPLPEVKQPLPDLAGGLESVYNSYLKSKQEGRAQDAANQAAQLQALQMKAAQQGIAAGERTANLANMQEAAQFGAPVADFTPQERAAAAGSQPLESSGIGPMRPDILDKMSRLREGLLKLGGKGDLSQELTRSQILKNKADAEKASKESGPGSKEQIATENLLRDELNKLSQPFQQVRDSFGRIQAAAKNPSAAGDLALIFNYMKVLDPGSTVREGEFATAQNSAGIPQRLVAQYNKVVNGERLAPEQRQDFVSRAEELYKSQESIQKRQEQHYKGIAERSNARPENVIFDRSLGTKTESIKPGTIEDGYRFNGGNPADKSSWVKL